MLSLICSLERRAVALDFCCISEEDLFLFSFKGKKVGVLFGPYPVFIFRILVWIAYGSIYLGGTSSFIDEEWPETNMVTLLRIKSWLKPDSQ